MRAALLAAAALTACAQAPLERGVAWLAAHQHPDGAWRSEEIAALSGGATMTAWIAALPVDVPGIDRALQWLRGRIDPDGRVGRDELPGYATALTLTAFVRRRPEWKEEIARLAAALQRAQQDSGGWGNTPQFADLSTTAFVLEALAQAGALEPVRARASAFVDSCGGTHFTPHPAFAFKNKAGPGRAYGTVIADTIRARRALGETSGIAPPPDGESPPGFGPDVDPAWPRGLRFYWWFARGSSPEYLLRLQRPDGSWTNDAGLMLEHEPLIATGLALGVLTR